MLYRISLFIGSHQVSSFNINSKDNLSIILSHLDKNLTANFKSNVIYLKSKDFSKKDMLRELKLLATYYKISQNSLIINTLLRYYVNNNFKHAPISLTCNDYKLDSKIDLKSFKLNTHLYC